MADKPGDESLDPAPTPPPAPGGQREEAGSGAGWDDDPQDFRYVVRPYTWTRGRTRPVQDLQLETLVSTTGHGHGHEQSQSLEHQAVASLCQQVRSVAEVAALLALPLGVARVLLADMVSIGLVTVHQNPDAGEDGPDLALLERVLAGLHQL